MELEVAAALLFPTMSLLLGGPSSGGGGGRAVPLLAASGKGLSANSACWVASCTPWACMGMLQQCPLTRHPSMPNVATALFPLVTQPVSVHDPESHS